MPRICLFRIECRNKSLSRKLNRQVEKIKLRLVEQDHDIEFIETVDRCRSNSRNNSVLDVQKHLDNPRPQM